MTDTRAEPDTTGSLATDRAGVARDARTVASLTLVSRVLGLVRDLATVRLFGDTVVGSAFAAALAIPNMFRRLFGEGALSAAFLPEYAALSRDDPRRADALATLVVAMLALVTGTITIVIELVLLAILLASGDDPDRTLSLRLIIITLPFMPLVCIAAILGGVLQTHGRFAPWAAAPIVLNVCILVVAGVAFFGTDTLLGGATLRPETWAAWIGVAVVVSGVLQVLWAVLALRGVFAFSWNPGAVWGRTRTMLARMGPAIIGLGSLQLNTLADTVLAMWPNLIGPTMLGHPVPMDEASNSVLFYAQRLYQFPLGVFGIAIATAVFPRLAREAATPEQFVATMREGLRLSWFVTLPATVGLVLIAPDLVALLFGGDPSAEGELGTGFSQSGVDRATAVLVAYGAAVWAYSLNQVWTRSFYARGDTSTPMRVALGFVVVNIALNFVLIWPFRELGLAISTAICASAQCLTLGWLAQRSVLAPILDTSTVKPFLSTLASGAVLGATVLGVLLLTDWLWNRYRIDNVGDRMPTWLLAARVGGVVLLGGAVHIIYARWTRAPELGWIFARGTKK